VHCPSDGSELFRFSFRDIELDMCRQCGGIWFDRGELDELLRTALREPRAVGDVDPRAGAPVERFPPRALACPRCDGAALTQVAFGGVSGIELDGCPRCAGHWADGGELDALVRFLHTPIKPERLRAYGEAIAQAVAEREKLKDLTAFARETGVPVFTFLPRIILPLGSTVGVYGVPVATAGLVLATALAFVFQLIEGSGAVIERFGVVPARLAQGEGIYTLLTSVFVHVGILHLLGNMWFFWIFARPVELTFGRLRFLACYLVCGAVAGLVDALVRFGDGIPAVGASGAISGVMGAYLILYPSSCISTFIIQKVVDVPAWLYLGAWVGLQGVYLLIDTSLDFRSGTAFSAHIGGFVAGAVIAWRYKRRAG